jgi:propanol-preferring alcohol dehydrogenase
MKAMVLNETKYLQEGKRPLELTDVPLPVPGEEEILVKVTRCGVCHTELDEIEGRTPLSRLPIILGHQIVGRVERMGRKSQRFAPGERVGIAWIYSACGQCKFCLEGNENLCAEFRATGRDANGGYAEYTVVREDFAYRIPEVFSDSEAAPLLCAGAIGYRSLKLTGLRDGENIGLTGFGASGPPEKLNVIIDTTPAWKPVVKALRALERGGRLIINAIRKEEWDKEALLELDYPADLWMEKELKSVANITRRDVEEFLALAAEIPIRPEIQEYALHEANRALMELKQRKIRGAKVLKI